MKKYNDLKVILKCADCEKTQEIDIYKFIKEMEEEYIKNEWIELQCTCKLEKTKHYVDGIAGDEQNSGEIPL